MGFFDKLRKSVSGTTSYADNYTAAPPVDRRTIPASEIDRLQQIPASPQYQQLIHSRYYTNYPEKPYISRDREINTNWLEQAEFMLQNTKIDPRVPLKNMVRFSDGLLPGHIYMLFWLEQNGAGKRIPSYFEYKYGINFNNEYNFLSINGYIADAKPTPKGTYAITTHHAVIDEHSPEATSAKQAQQQFANSEYISIMQPKKLNGFSLSAPIPVDGRNLVLVEACNKPRIFSDIAVINNLLCSVRSELKIKDLLSIPESEIKFNRKFTDKLYSYFEYEPLTATGKPAKYPIILYFATRDHYDPQPAFECFGSISYLKDNRIGNVTLNLWHKTKGYHVSMGIINDALTIKKVDQSVKGVKTTIYKK